MFKIAYRLVRFMLIISKADKLLRYNNFFFHKKTRFRSAVKVSYQIISSLQHGLENLINLKMTTGSSQSQVR